MALNEKSKAALATKSVRFGFAGTNMISEVVQNQGISPFVSIITTLFLVPFTYFLDWSTLNQKFYSAVLGYKLPTFSCALSNTVPAAMAILFRPERIGVISLAGKAKLPGAIICMIGVMFVTLCREITRKLCRRPQHLALEEKETLSFGLSLQNSRVGIALIIIFLLMINIAAAVAVVDNTASEGVEVGDRLPPDCQYVDNCGLCLRCYQSGRGFNCCD